MRLWQHPHGTHCWRVFGLDGQVIDVLYNPDTLSRDVRALGRRVARVERVQL